MKYHISIISHCSKRKTYHKLRIKNLKKNYLLLLLYIIKLLLSYYCMKIYQQKFANNRNFHDYFMNIYYME